MRRGRHGAECIYASTCTPYVTAHGALQWHMSQVARLAVDVIGRRALLRARLAAFEGPLQALLPGLPTRLSGRRGSRLDAARVRLLLAPAWTTSGRRRGIMADTKDGPPATPLETSEEGFLRFQVELEFVQALASPTYVHCTQRWPASPRIPRPVADVVPELALAVPRIPDLAQNGFLKDPRLVAYLEYLQYWKRPPYVQFIRCGQRLSMRCIQNLVVLTAADTGLGRGRRQVPVRAGNAGPAARRACADGGRARRRHAAPAPAAVLPLAVPRHRRARAASAHHANRPTDHHSRGRSDARGRALGRYPTA